MLTALRRGLWLIVAAALVAGAAGYLLAAVQPATYTAQAVVILSASQNFSPLGDQSGGDPSRHIADQVALVNSHPVLGLAATNLADGTTADDLASIVSVGASSDNDVFTVAASGPSASAAARRANAVVGGYRQFVSEAVSRAANAAASAATDPVIKDQILTRAAAYGDGVMAAQLASPPAKASSPSAKLDALLLAAVGALIGAGIAIWRRPSGGGATSEPPSVPMLGTVPIPRGRGGLRVTGDHALVMVALEYARRDTQGPVLIAGASSKSGAAAVAYGLAVAATAQDRRVLLVDAAPGTREVLAREGSPALSFSLRSLQRSPGTGTAVVVPPPLPVPGTPGLFLSLLGEAEGRPINDESLRQAFGALRTSFDLVIVQTAPVQVSPLAFGLVGHCDTVIAALGVKEKPELLGDVRQRLKGAHRDVTGVVMTRAVRSERPRNAPPGDPRDGGQAPAPNIELSGNPAH